MGNVQVPYGTSNIGSARRPIAYFPEPIAQYPVAQVNMQALSGVLPAQTIPQQLPFLRNYTSGSPTGVVKAAELLRGATIARQHRILD